MFSTTGFPDLYKHGITKQFTTQELHQIAL